MAPKTAPPTVSSTAEGIRNTKRSESSATKRSGRERSQLLDPLAQAVGVELQPERAPRREEPRRSASHDRARRRGDSTRGCTGGPSGAQRRSLRAACGRGAESHAYGPFVWPGGTLARSVTSIP